MKDLHKTRISRRRALFVGASLLGGALASKTLSSEAPIARWTGNALGAHAKIELVGVKPDKAGSIFHSIESEIARLEAIFSLYRTDSSIVRLNSDGTLADPPPELLEVLAMSSVVHNQTHGLFDPTIQPLFAFYAAHFSKGSHAKAKPAEKELVDALSLVGFDKLRFNTRAISFEKRGMAITLNGIAQGYITDRVGDILREQGFTNLLVDIGEISAIGSGHDGQGWRIGIQEAPQSNTVSRRLRITDRAVATSMMFGTTFDDGQRAGHILHPRIGLIKRFNNRATVVGHSAALADALSTAAILLEGEALAELRSSGAEIYI